MDVFTLPLILRPHKQTGGNSTIPAAAATGNVTVAVQIAVTPSSTETFAGVATTAAEAAAEADTQLSTCRIPTAAARTADACEPETGADTTDQLVGALVTS